MARRVSGGGRITIPALTGKVLHRVRLNGLDGGEIRAVCHDCQPMWARTFAPMHTVVDYLRLAFMHSGVGDLPGRGELPAVVPAQIGDGDVDLGTCGELAALLAAQPPGCRVILARTRDADDGSPLHRARQARYVPDSGWSGTVFPSPDYIAGDPDASEDKDGPAGDAQAETVIVLHPTD